MELHEFTIHIPKRQRVSIIPLGDTHIGSKACAIDKLKELVAWIRKTPDVYVVGMGDYIDAINLSDPRFNPSLLSDKTVLSRLAQSQCEECVDIFKPIAPKIIGMAIGNHEMTIGKKYHFDAMYQICGQLKAKYLGWSSLTRLRILRNKCSNIINIFAEHSLSAGKKKGAKVNALEDRSNDIEADIYLRGHSHDKL